ncbi:phospholipase carboxylesterase [Fusarium longipes]|uniref:Phospholipase carboxylesterase n=1 Tax=Fusarium longipes TaxID=694270 RepID=A0A395S4C9_9HYPO|nr:phospholipase carboxylesterase [Fusarium longipes]
MDARQQHSLILVPTSGYTNVVRTELTYDMVLGSANDKRVKYSIIWLHNQTTILNLKEFLTNFDFDGSEKLSERQNIRHRAPFLPNIVFGPYPQWWEFSPGVHNGTGEWWEVRNALARLGDTIEAESKLVGKENIILVGFGHGCAVGMMYLMETNQPLGAFCGYGGYIPLRRDMNFIKNCGQHPATVFRLPTRSVEPISGESMTAEESDALDSLLNDVLQQGDDDEENQSPTVKLDRVASFLRSLHWKSEHILDSAGKTGIDTPVFLTYRSAFREQRHAFKWLQHLGFTVHLNRTKSRSHEAARKDSVSFLIKHMVTNKLGPWSV